MRVLTVTFQISGSLQVMIGISVIVFLTTGGNLTTQRLFTTLSLVSALNSRSGINLVVSFFYLYEVMVALSRIEVSVRFKFCFYCEHFCAGIPFIRRN